MKHNIDNQILRKLNMTVKRLYNTSARHAAWLLLLMVIVVGSTTTSMAGVVIKGNVYGGGNAADVGTDATVNISGGQIGDTQIDDDHGNVFGGGKGQVTTVVGNVIVNIGKKVTIVNEQQTVTYSNNNKVTIKGSIYGGSALGAVNATKDNDWDKTHLDRISATSNKTTEVNIYAGTVNGNIYGGGRGALAEGTEGQPGYSAPVEAKSFGAVTVSIGVATSSAATTTPVVEGSVYGGSNVNGFLENSARVDVVSGTIGKSTTENGTTTISGGYVHGGGYGQPTLVKGDVTVNIGAISGTSPDFSYYGYATIFVDVYGGSAKGNVNATKNGSDILVVSTYTDPNDNTKTLQRKTNVNLYGGTVNGDIYGGGLGDNTTNAEIAANVYGPVTVTTNGGTARNVFGCNNLYGAPQSTVQVNISGGSVTQDVYGGGNLANTTVSPIVNVTNGTVSRDVYGGGALANTGGTTVNITGGTVTRDIYGGGLGDNTHTAEVNGDVLVNIGSMQAGATENDSPTYSGSATINGSVYGCNNANGSPTGNVVVNIYKTAHTTTPINNQYPEGVTTLEGLNDLSNGDNRFAIKAVYGGGNLASYTPEAPTGNNPTPSTTVHVYGCEENTIKTIYGGGNAADVGTTGNDAVTANTNLIIEGGRFDRVFGGGNGYSSTGNHNNPSGENYNPGANIYGTATTDIRGGLFGQVFGGSNQYGNVTSTSLTINKVCGTMLINESFGGANEADIDGSVETTLACSDNEIGTFYGGSNLANISGNVTLNVKGGTYLNVFGGSKGRLADNSDPNNPIAAKAADIGGDVTLNLYGGTMDNAFGGSDVNGNISGNITVNMLNLGGDCGLVVHNIYGGGRDAEYIPTTPGPYPEVNLIHGSVSKKTDGTDGNVFGGGLGSTAIVTSHPTVNVGYVTSMSTLVASLLPANTTFSTANVTVEGDVYGGGEEAAVNGNTTVTVQQGTVDGITITTEVNGDVYGGGALANVGTSSSNTTQVTVSGGTVGNVYGGGLGRIGADAVNYTQDEADAYNTAHELTEGQEGYVTIETVKTPAVTAVAASVNGAVTVNINGGSITNVYGCNNQNGAPQSTVTVNVTNGSANNVFGGGNQAAYGGTPDVNISGGAVNQVFGGGNEAGVGGGDIAISNGSITSGVYGGCNSSGEVGGNITISLTGGTIGAAAVGSESYEGYVAEQRADVYGGGFGSSTTTTGNISVTLNGTTVYGDIYGGSALGCVNASNSNTNTITLSTATLHGSVFGGGKGDNASEGTGHNDVTATSNGNATINYNIANTNLTGLYGGANVRGNVKGAIAVNINANVGASGNGNSLDIFGGGYGAHTNSEGNVTVTIGDAAGTYTPVIYGDIYGGSALGNVNNDANDLTKVDFLNGTLHGNIYGGGLGRKAVAEERDQQTNEITTQAVEAAEAKVYGQVQVNISNAEQAVENCHIDLRETSIYGCNNTNGSPQDNVTVNIYKTAYNYSDYTTGDKYTASYTQGEGDPDPAYAINQVFGGGNQADYAPENGLATSTKKATVNIIGCNNTIQRVFGGGNAAAAMGVATTIAGGRFDYIFGGGNGESAAADIGAGGTNLTVNSGVINHLFGGGNVNGTITGPMLVAVNNTGCTEDITEFFAGGNLADIGDAQHHVNLSTTIACGTVFGSVYGGSKLADIYGNVTLNVNGGTIGEVYAGSMGRAAVTADPDNGIEAVVGKAANIYGNTILNINGGAIGNAFGGSNINGNITGSITVNMDWSQSNCAQQSINNIYGASNLATYTPTNPGSYPAVNIKHGTVTQNVFGGGKGDPNDATKGVVTSNPVVTIGDNISNTTYAVVSGNVYGGGDAAAVTGYTTVNYNDTNASSTVANLFGGGNAAGVSGNTNVYMTAGKVTTTIYGGCNDSGSVGGNATVSVTGGTIGTAPTGDTAPSDAVFGGGKGEPTLVEGNVIVNIGTSGQETTGATINGHVYGGSALGNTNASMSENVLVFHTTGTGAKTTTVNLYKGTINGDVFGGGLGRKATNEASAVEAFVGGDVTITLDGAKLVNIYSAISEATHETGHIFGCNNLNGTPKGHVLVDVKRTVEVSGQTYDVVAVYGGGNEADYKPTDTKLSTEVLIEGECDNSTTKIENVYGGGNAAAVPASEVWIFGATAIDNVFGGGNGERGAAYAAHVGYYRTSSDKEAYETGSGKALVYLVAGTINKVYGGSNRFGNIRGGTDVKTKKVTDYSGTATDTKCCSASLNTQYIFGGGNAAEMTGNIEIKLECMPDDYVDAVYGGANDAIVTGNVKLIVSSGKFGRVFGGNNSGGSINGTITVYVKEEGCENLEIGELYGGGNEAPYSKFGCYQDNNNKWHPYESKSIDNNNFEASFDQNNDGVNDEEPYHVKVFVESCTSIGKIFGGGKGTDAVVIGDTYVNINEMYGNVNNKDKTTLGHIGQVFGGGSAANVKGNTKVDIGTATANGAIGVNITKTIGEVGSTDYDNTKYLNPDENSYIRLDGGVYGGGLSAEVDGNTTINIGTAEQSLGTNIDGSIYGGGKEGDVTGNTQVNICAIKNNDNTYSSATLSNAGVTITGNVFGAGQGVASDVTKALVSGNSTLVMAKGSVKKSIYGGGETSQVAGNTEVKVIDGTIGTDNEGGAVFGNVYGGGLGCDGTGAQTDVNKVKAGLVKGNTRINISGGTILHNVYGGGAYGSVGDFTYNESTGVITGYTAGGKTEVYITGGTFGTTGKENGMVFGSSRGDVGAPDAIHDKLAWVYDTEVKIGTQDDETDGPTIKGSVYGGGENGHNYRNADVYIYSGTIGINNNENVTYYDDPDDNTKVTYTGKDYNYSYRGNVYGAGCGTDKYKYDSDNNGSLDAEAFNPKAGIVQGNATIRMSGGTVVHNIYGAGAMGSVGTTTTGGVTTINISGGTVGVDGTVGGGNVFGAARGDAAATSNEYALVLDHTSVNISDGTIYGNVYGGGELGCVGRYVISNDMKDFYWTNTPLNNIDPNNASTYTYNNTGICNVNITGGTIGIDGALSNDHGNVFGGGKGKGDTFWCEKGMVYRTTVNISKGTVKGDVFGGGEVGRVEENTTVTIGPESGEDVADIKGDVFGAGKGLETHGYSALVRGNPTVTVQGHAKVRGSVYGGGEIASAGRHKVKTANGTPPTPPDAPADLPVGMPYTLDGTNVGECTVNIKDNAEITGNVFGAGKGLVPVDYNTASPKPTRMTLDNSGNSIWETLNSEADYLIYVQTLALATDTHVTIGGGTGTTTVKGSVYGGSQSGFVQYDTEVTTQGTCVIGTIVESTTTGGDVYGGGLGVEGNEAAGRVSGSTVVNINNGSILNSVYGGGAYGIVRQNVTVNVRGGIVTNDVYGGGALADTNTDNWNANGFEEVSGLTAGESVVTGLYSEDNNGNHILISAANTKATENTTYYQKGTWATNMNNASTGTTYKTAVNLTGGIIGNAYGGGLGNETTPAYVYGDVTVTIDGVASRANNSMEISFTDENNVVQTEWVPLTGRIFGANNVNGTPKGNIKVLVNSTKLTENGTTTVDTHTIDKFELHSVYGGGNLANYLPADGKNTEVEVYGCDATSIQYVYGGGNSASVPQTKVTIYSCFQIGYVFGGGNGFDPVQNSEGDWVSNPGADVRRVGGVSGTGQILAKGGTIGWIYGGSNKKGICGHIEEKINKEGDCPLKVTHVYGAGKNADIDGNVDIVIMCPGNDVDYVYGGSLDARIAGNVKMTIIGGQIKNVFGGNDAGGSIGGTIEVNVQETHSCQPVIIDNLYGGGNLAAYPNTADNTNPKITVNVNSCTHIGNVFGGGKGDATGTRAIVTGDTEVNINLAKGVWAGSENTATLYRGNMTGSAEAVAAAIATEIPNIEDISVNTTAKTISFKVKDEIGTIGNVYGGGDAAAINGNAIVNIGNMATVPIMKHDTNGVPLNANDQPIYDHVTGEPFDDNRSTEIVYNTPDVLGANITGDVYGGGNEANVTGNTYVNISALMTPVNNNYKVDHSNTANFEGLSIGGSVYGGGCKADVLKNTFVRMEDGYVFNGIFGGGYSGSVGSASDEEGSIIYHTGSEAHTGCIGKIIKYKADTGKCTVVVNGGQIGPDEVATQGMNRITNNKLDPIPQGWVWGAGCGIVDNPANDPDMDFRTYVKETDVTIGGTAFIMESVIGGGEFGRVLGDTKVTIEGNCQIGAGYNYLDETSHKPKRYAEELWKNAAAAVAAGNADDINTVAGKMFECSHFPYQSPYLPYDPYYEYSTNKIGTAASTENPSDGKTWIGCVFGGGSGYMPYKVKDSNDHIISYDWVPSAGLVEGNTEVNITGGHILTNVYGGNEVTNVTGKCTVKMSGGTIGVPRTLDQIAAHPVTCYLFGAGKGDPRSHFDTYTNVGSVDIEVSGGIIFGSVFGGSEDGHVLGDVNVKIKEGTEYTIGGTGGDTYTKPIIGTWGTSYVDGNVFGGGRGFSGENLNSGSVTGDVDITIEGGTMLGSIYGGGRLGSVTGDVDIAISGGTIGNTHEYVYNPAASVIDKTTGLLRNTDFEDYTFKEGNTSTTIKRLKHTKGGNVYAGGMGRMMLLDGSTPISAVDWWKLGNVKSTKLTISGGTIKSNVYGGCELGMVTGTHTSADSKTVSTEITISGGTIGTEITNKVGDVGVTQYTFGSVFGGGYGSITEELNHTGSSNPTYATYTKTYPKYIAGRVKGSTEVTMTGGEVKASVYGGGEMAAVGESIVLANPGVNDPTVLGETLTGAGETPTPMVANTYVTISGGTIGIDKVGDKQFGGATMGNVYGGGSGYINTVRSGQIFGNTNVNISQAEGKTTRIYHNVYGGGAYGTVGDFTYIMEVDEETHTKKVSKMGGLHTDRTGTGTSTVTITGGTIGVDGHENGMIFGSSRGDVDMPGKRPDWLAWVNDANVEINGANVNIKGSVYGGGENGHVYRDAKVDVKAGTIGDPNDNTYPYRGNVYGAGCGTDKYYSTSTELYDGEGDKYNPLAGIVQGSTYVTVSGGTVARSVYGGGAMGSVGNITNYLDEKYTSGENNGKYKYKHIYSDATTGNEDQNLANATTFYNFGLSWPYELIYGDYSVTENNSTVTKTSGLAKVIIKDGATIGVNVYGAARGGVQVGENDITKHRYEEAKLANVREAQVIIGTASGTQPTINGSVYGGGEDGHVYEDASVTINGGTIAHSVFGGGKGEGTFTSTLWKGTSTTDLTLHEDLTNQTIHSWTAGRVYGNTNVTMNGGSVGYFVYGGGNLGSVGKGNYAGGADDYATGGYGEMPESNSANLWTTAYTEQNQTKDMAWHFANTGITTVNILGGEIGKVNNVEQGFDLVDNLPYGSVFGGSRGQAAMDVGRRSPRYRYVPDFFLGYVNKAIVNIGGTSTTDLASTSPTIYGSVYGGGQDGHVRNSTKVNIYKGKIEGQTTDIAKRSGHVFGAGSGIGQYTDIYDDNELKVGNSSGSVTCTSTVEVYGEVVNNVNRTKISGNVYGGGAMASVGPPKMGSDELKAANGNHKSYSYTLVNIHGGEIGGDVYGASRGPSDAFLRDRLTTENGTLGDLFDPTKFATDIWSDVNVSGGTIKGSVFGGGEAGQVKCDVNVNITDGTIETDVYGGGAMAHTNTSNWDATANEGAGGWASGKTPATYTTNVSLHGGTIKGDVYGGGLGRMEVKTGNEVTTTAVEAKEYGNILVALNETPTVTNEVANFPDNCVVQGRIFGCNNLNGSPQGTTTVHVYKTQGWTGHERTAQENLNNKDIEHTYHVAAVYGGGNLAMFKPDLKATTDTVSTHVIIDGCGLTSIKQVYGGGNAAPVPATHVIVNGTYEIDELFGGGNGKDNYKLKEGDTDVWYENFGANVGYKNYYTYTYDETGTNTEQKPRYKAVINNDATTKEARAKYMYGTGKAKSEIYGGRIHAAYGGSNEKGNISSTVMSKYDTESECEVIIDETYGGSKNATVDGQIIVDLGCVDYMAELFGGSQNADVNSDIELNITNGTYGKVFGGNNTSGAIAGSITVNVEEKGCSPIIIGELYGGGYLAPYSIYGYKSDGRGGYDDGDLIDYGGTIGTIQQRHPLTKAEYENTALPEYRNLLKTDLTNLGFNETDDPTEAQIAAKVAAAAAENPSRDLTRWASEYAAIKALIAAYPKKDPRINVISATHIGTIYGGGYMAKVVGSPHVNVNMQKGMLAAKYIKSDFLSEHTDSRLGYPVVWKGESYDTEDVTVGNETKHNGILSIGKIGSVFGGGNLADIDGNTYVEIGTGKWLTWDTNGYPVYESKGANGKTYTYKVKNQAGYYSDEYCTTNNAALTGAISTATTLTAEQATRLNELLGLSGNDAYNAGGHPSQVHANAYNATLDGYITPVDVQTNAVWAWYDGETELSAQPAPARNAATITGDVFGGGKGEADNFTCDKAMVGAVDEGMDPTKRNGGTSVIIENGTVGGSVYGGGKIARVEKNSEVTIGTAYGITGTESGLIGAPVIEGNVFGAGQGVATHGYSGLVRGNSSVIVQANAKVKGSVYGGGEKASVGRFFVATSPALATAHGVEVGMPYDLKSGGTSSVIIRGNAEIGPDTPMKMYHVDNNGDIVANDKPDDKGHVFGSSKGIIPYLDTDTKSGTEEGEGPGRWYAPDNVYTWESYAADDETTETAYLNYSNTLGITNKSNVTISGNAFVKGSVYGGAENGHVREDTHVTIAGGQIGQGKTVTTRYDNGVWGDDYEPTQDLECASWPYGVDTDDDDKADTFAPYDKFAHSDGYYYNGETKGEFARGGRLTGSDGHTFYGNVFGGGSGYYPYKPGKWHRGAGSVGGNTVVDITGGHILTSVYGGNEMTDVGTYTKDTNNEPIVPKSGGKCTINMTGGTLGVPRTLAQIAAHPVICYLFGAGKGDQRTFFNTLTNIREAEVNVTGNARIYGSVFGGGEDGHVIENAKTNIGGTVTIGNTTYTPTNKLIIGTTGTSYVDGNIFGAGRGFGGDAITAGSVGGNVEVNISGGTMLGSVYGGGRLASVGIGFNAPTSSHYGQYTEDANNKTYGHVTVNISGGTIGNDLEDKKYEIEADSKEAAEAELATRKSTDKIPYTDFELFDKVAGTGNSSTYYYRTSHTKGGNVFGGSMGRLKLLDETINPLWPQLGQAKTTTVNISGNNTVIKGNVYGGSEMGTVRDNTTIVVGKTSKTDETVTKPTIVHDVYGGGYGSDDFESKGYVKAKDTQNNTHIYKYTPMKWAGCVGKSTEVNIYGGWVKQHVYGGGEMASVGIINYEVGVQNDESTDQYLYITKHADETNSFALSWPYETQYVNGYPGTAKINITGGRIGTDGESVKFGTQKIGNGDVYGGGKGIAGDRYYMAFCANVGSTEVNIGYPKNNNLKPSNYQNYTDLKYDCITGAVYGGGENGHVMGDAKVTLTQGLIGHSLYGGGSGKGKYTVNLYKIGSTTDTHPVNIYSITAGKVYGNTSVTMTDGCVVRNIYGGGNMGSVGKGNYAGGTDDYYTAGYGETLQNENLWIHSNSFDPDAAISSENTPKTMADYFLSSGKTTVEITGGQVGYVDTTDPSNSYKDDLPYGNVFGGSRGESAPNIMESPRYHYSPEFFSGYVNKTNVTIGTAGSSTGPKILGSVYGGGQDGHVRQDTHVTVNSGEIGLPFTNEPDANYNNVKWRTLFGWTASMKLSEELDNPQWLFRGNVFGAGSGIGKYKYDFDGNGRHTIAENGDEEDETQIQTWSYVNPLRPSAAPTLMKEIDYSTSAGSVTRFTQVDINGGTIHRNVYGGGSLSSVGPPTIPPTRTETAYKPGVTTRDTEFGGQTIGQGWWSQCTVNIKGTIGTPTDYKETYGGEVYGASRGNSKLDVDSFAHTVWTQVNILNGANILGNVFGGGDAGKVKRDTDVQIGAE